ncbi:hypothetical protein [Parasitella parasitica]|uniref:Retrotransposon gag domain-containing protein n=1 Tax=Parasitella parasitica TaxID=35722 RepID=A0A0B7NE32_9FUNG|nr:hypothetical protein [Parasitella parasitica]
MPTFDVPKFQTKDDPELWLYRYVKSSQMNDWDEKTMLNYVDNCFEEGLQLWCMHNSFSSWDNFKSAFLNKFSKEVNLSKLIAEITNMRKNENETQRNHEKNPVKQEALNNNNSDTIIELIITEAGFMKCFLKGLLSKSLKREVKGQKFNNVDQMLLWIKEMYESDETDNSRDDSGNDSDDGDQALQTKLQKFNKKTAEETNKSKMEETFESVMNNMFKDFSNMVLLIGELNTKITNNIAAGKKKIPLL